MLNRQKNTKLFSLGYQPGIKPVFFIFLIIFFHFSHLHTQENLVPNGDFEEYDWCPQGLADLSVREWSSPTGATPDYFNSCNSNDVSIPINFSGRQFPVSNFGYSGFLAGGFTNSQPQAREYLQVKLGHNLVENEIYELSFFLSLAEISRFSCRKIEFAFSDDVINETFSTNINFLQNINEIDIGNFGDTVNWIECKNIFLANGSEKYLIIGLFKDDSNAEYNLFNDQMTEFAYYYIDDVSLVKLSHDSIPNVFTPNDDGFNDFWTFMFIKNTNIQIINRWGDLVFSDFSLNGQITWNGVASNNQLCSDGIYYFVLELENKKIRTGFIHLIR